MSLISLDAGEKLAGLEKVVESEDDQEVGLESGQEPVVDADVGAGADSDVGSTPEPDLEQ